MKYSIPFARASIWFRRKKSTENILLSRIIALNPVSPYLFPRKKKVINRGLITGVSNQGKNPRSRWKPLCNNVEDEKVTRYATPSNRTRGGTNTRDKEFHGEPNLRCVYVRETKMAIVISLRLIHVNYDRDAAKKKVDIGWKTVSSPQDTRLFFSFLLH